MKLRIRGDSIRLRLTQKEVGVIAQGKLVEDCLRFAGGTHLRYSLEPSSGLRDVEASFVDGRVIVALPLDRALEWARGTEVAILSGEGLLPSILVEKDFACLKPRVHENEDESDMFPNPNLAHGHCT